MSHGLKRLGILAQAIGLWSLNTLGVTMAGRPWHKYYCPALGLTVHLPGATLAQLWAYRQTTSAAKEAGGMLFTRTLAGHSVDVSAISLPGCGDQATPTSFIPDRARGKKEIERRFRRGQHFIGEWHSHYERHPTPSPQDRSTIRSLFQSSKHDLPMFLMLIISSEADASLIHISATNGKALYEFIYQGADTS
ncbi:Mov34/MPN/PAD-1 family protein [Aeromonas piscicola]